MEANSVSTGPIGPARRTRRPPRSLEDSIGVFELPVDVETNHSAGRARAALPPNSQARASTAVVRTASPTTNERGPAVAAVRKLERAAPVRGGRTNGKLSPVAQLNTQPAKPVSRRGSDVAQMFSLIDVLDTAHGEPGDFAEPPSVPSPPAAKRNGKTAAPLAHTQSELTLQESVAQTSYDAKGSREAVPLASIEARPHPWAPSKYFGGITPHQPKAPEATPRPESGVAALPIIGRSRSYNTSSAPNGSRRAATAATGVSATPKARSSAADALWSPQMPPPIRPTEVKARDGPDPADANTPRQTENAQESGAQPGAYSYLALLEGLSATDGDSTAHSIHGPPSFYDSRKDDYTSATDALNFPESVGSMYALNAMHSDNTMYAARPSVSGSSAAAAASMILASDVHDGAHWDEKLGLYDTANNASIRVVHRSGGASGATASGPTHSARAGDADALESSGILQNPHSDSDGDDVDGSPRGRRAAAHPSSQKLLADRQHSASYRHRLHRTETFGWIQPTSGSLTLLRRDEDSGEPDLGTLPRGYPSLLALRPHKSQRPAQSDTVDGETYAQKFRDYSHPLSQKGDTFYVSGKQQREAEAEAEEQLHSLHHSDDDDDDGNRSDGRNSGSSSSSSRGGGADDSSGSSEDDEDDVHARSAPERTGPSSPLRAVKGSPPYRRTFAASAAPPLSAFERVPGSPHSPHSPRKSNALSPLAQRGMRGGGAVAISPTVSDASSPLRSTVAPILRGPQPSWQEGHTPHVLNPFRTDIPYKRTCNYKKVHVMLGLVPERDIRWVPSPADLSPSDLSSAGSPSGNGPANVFPAVVMQAPLYGQQWA